MSELESFALSEQVEAQAPEFVALPRDYAPEKSTLILALGNPLRGDDGAGSAVLEALERKAGLPKTVTLLDGGTGGLETLLLMQDYDHVILIDAAELGMTAGNWARIRYRDDPIEFSKAARRDSMHRSGLAEALELGEALEILPSEIVLYAIQPAGIGWNSAISPEVKSAISEICTDIYDRIKTIADCST